jgi:uncharacterized protein YdhG (YjbR/CyaY superfamily)
MAKAGTDAVNAYFARQPAAVQKVLSGVRATLRKALGGADEVISYQIPTYQINGTAVVYLAAWKRHYSIYPITSRLLEALGPELEPYWFPKDTLRFQWSAPVPGKLIERIAKLRAREVLERAAGKAPPVTTKRLTTKRPTKKRLTPSTRSTKAVAARAAGKRAATAGTKKKKAKKQA